MRPGYVSSQLASVIEGLVAELALEMPRLILLHCINHFDLELLRDLDI